MSARPGRFTLVRDVTSYVLGLLLILKQAGIGFDPPPQTNLPVLVTGGLLVGVPGLAQLVMWWLGGRAGMDGQPSLPAPPPLSSSGTQSPEPSGADR